MPLAAGVRGGVLLVKADENLLREKSQRRFIVLETEDSKGKIYGVPLK